MAKNYLHTILIITLFYFLCSIRSFAQTSDQPNIIFILPDDLGWADVGYHGSEIKTPNIDQLARAGKIFSQHYVMPTCTPTRVSLMTGKYPSRYGILAPDYGEVIDLGDPTLASMLSDLGYFTAINGKWHMGSPPYTPLKYGFDSSYGYFDGQIDPYTHEYKTETDQTERRSWHRNDEYLDESGKHVTDLITKEAIRIIEDERMDPFFLYVTHHVPHSPLDEPEKYQRIYDDFPLMHPTRRVFAAAVSHLDESIGEIVKALERAGKRENTLIIFISDNGGQHSWASQTNYRGAYAEKPHLVLGNNFPLKGWKHTLYEGGIRVPGFVNWPGKISPGIVDQEVHVSDWLPTLYHLVSGSQVSHRIDGRDIWPLVSGEKEKLEKKPLYWKIRGTFAVRDGDWKMLLHNEKEAELYNLKEDFREDKNLAQEHPEKLEQMMNLLESFKTDDRERKN